MSTGKGSPVPRDSSGTEFSKRVPWYKDPIVYSKTSGESWVECSTEDKGNTVDRFHTPDN